MQVQIRIMKFLNKRRINSNFTNLKVKNINSEHNILKTQIKAQTNRFSTKYQTSKTAIISIKFALITRVLNIFNSEFSTQN